MLIDIKQPFHSKTTSSKVGMTVANSFELNQKPLLGRKTTNRIERLFGVLKSDLRLEYKSPPHVAQITPSTFHN